MWQEHFSAQDLCVICLLYSTLQCESLYLAHLSFVPLSWRLKLRSACVTTSLATRVFPVFIWRQGLTKSPSFPGWLKLSISLSQPPGYESPPINLVLHFSILGIIVQKPTFWIPSWHTCKDLWSTVYAHFSLCRAQANVVSELYLCYKPSRCVRAHSLTS